TALLAGVRRLADRLLRLPRPGTSAPALPRHDLARAITEAMVYLPVYRTYVDDRRGEIAQADRGLLEDSLAAARRGGRASPAAFDALTVGLLGGGDAAASPDQERIRRRFVQRFQQVSGPATAKGVEDTAFYAYVPLLSRNEGGGDPEAPRGDGPR